MMSVSSQRGSIFFYILLAVVLFAALGYAVANSMRGNSGVSNERLKLSASELITTGNTLSDAITRMRLRDVAKNAINFNSTVDTAYTNANCLTDECKVFSSSGGGISPETPITSLTPYGWGFTAALAFQDIGTATGDLIAIAPAVSADLCRTINSLLGLTTFATAPPVIASSFTGVDRYAGTNGTGAVNNAIIRGKKAACVQINSLDGTAVGGTRTNQYHYYQVLLAN